MTDDLMHERLAEAGARWRESQPERPVVVPPLRSRSPRWVVPAAAALVVAVAGGGWAVARLGQGPASSGGPAASTSSGPTPTHAVSPTPLPGPSPHGLRPCTADELHVTPSVEGAMGTTYLTLTISGPDDACRLQGFPEVTLLAGGQPLDVQVEQQPGRTHAVKVTPSPSATLVLGWSPTHSCADVDNDTIRVTLADGSSLEVPGFGQTSCNPGEADLQPLVVQPFAPVTG